jgi:hypothetical protein
MSNEPSNTAAQGTAASTAPSKKKHFIPLGTSNTQHLTTKAQPRNTPNHKKN